MLQIEIDVRDMYRGLGAGRRIVAYLGFKGDSLLCRDSLGNRVRLPRRMFRFVRALGRETRVSVNGHVEIKDQSEWRDLGPLSRDEDRRTEEVPPPREE